jgi:hypothetical protein
MVLAIVVLKIILLVNCAEKQKNKDNKIIIPLENYKNSQYIGKLQVGSQGQTMEFLFSTGTSLIWLFDKKCLDCATRGGYDTDSSYTFRNMTDKRNYSVSVIINSHNIIPYSTLPGNYSVTLLKT